MKTIRFSLCGLAFFMGSIAHPALAQDLELTFNTTGFGSLTYLSGKVQESMVTFNGQSPSLIVLKPGVPGVPQTHEATYDFIGVNDGNCVTAPTTEMHKIETTYTLSYYDGTRTVTKTLTLEQDATFFQICNDQFQFDLAPSEKKTLKLGHLGRLEVTAYPHRLQLLANSAGFGSHFQTRFVFVAGHARHDHDRHRDGATGYGDFAKWHSSRDGISNTVKRSDHGEYHLTHNQR